MAFIVILLVLQFGVVGNFSVSGVVPNLFLIALVWLALHRPFYESAYLAATGGLFFDLYSSSFFGTQIFAFILMAWLLHLLVTNVFPKGSNYFLLFGLLALLTVFYQFLQLASNSLFAYFQQEAALGWRWFFGPLGWQLLYNLAVCYPFVSLVRKILHEKISF